MNCYRRRADGQITEIGAFMDLCEDADERGAVELTAMYLDVVTRLAFEHFGVYQCRLPRKPR